MCDLVPKSLIDCTYIIKSTPQKVFIPERQIPPSIFPTMDKTRLKKPISFYRMGHKKTLPQGRSLAGAEVTQNELNLHGSVRRDLPFQTLQLQPLRVSQLVHGSAHESQLHQDQHCDRDGEQGDETRREAANESV